MTRTDNEREHNKAYASFGKRTTAKVIVKKQPHGQVVNDCIQWLFAHGCFVWPNRTGQYTAQYKRADGTTATYTIPYGKKGSGDIVGVTRTGVHIEIEAKHPDTGDKQRAVQNDHEQRIREKNGIYIVAFGIEELEANRELILGKTS